MTATMSLEQLTKSLKTSLMDSAGLFLDELPQLLTIAAEDLAKVRRRTLVGSIQLRPGKDIYLAPEDLMDFKLSTWGQQQRKTMKPWQPKYPRQLPDVSVLDGSPKYLVLSFIPTCGQIGLMGSEFRFFYFANHHIDEDGSKTTVSESERNLLLLRAQAEAMKWLSMRNVDKTVSAKHAISGASKGGVPAALYRILLEDWERRASC